MFGKWKEWERKGKTHRQMCKPHTCDRIAHKSLWNRCIQFFPWNTWHGQSYICGWGGHKMIRNLNLTKHRLRWPLCISYISRYKMITNSTNKLISVAFLLTTWNNSFLTPYVKPTSVPLDPPSTSWGPCHSPTDTTCLNTVSFVQ